MARIIYCCFQLPIRINSKKGVSEKANMLFRPFRRALRAVYSGGKRRLLILFLFFFPRGVFFGLVGMQDVLHGFADGEFIQYAQAWRHGLHQ